MDITPPLLMASQTSYLGVSCGHSLLREGADWRLPGTAASPPQGSRVELRVATCLPTPTTSAFSWMYCISMCVQEILNYLHTDILHRTFPQGSSIFLVQPKKRHYVTITIESQKEHHAAHRHCAPSHPDHTGGQDDTVRGQASSTALVSLYNTLEKESRGREK